MNVCADSPKIRETFTLPFHYLFKGFSKHYRRVHLLQSALFNVFLAGMWNEY